ncbi:unnamed protein product [Schistocephalus solidus]|uniref:Uncharacterized protein n=1 Tax=Schistocephalus solidus TaxID=70667 RepID=A0A183T8Z1_SCHSO|nr:unnamed protein product [Schistocephalus solidus]
MAGRQSDLLNFMHATRPIPSLGTLDSGDGTRLVDKNQKLQIVSTAPFCLRRPSVSESYIEKDLATCAHAYLQCDRVHRPLGPPYDGPFRVVSRGTNTFCIQHETCEEVVSVDRLKAAVPDEPCGSLPLILHIPHPLSLRPAYFLFL